MNKFFVSIILLFFISVSFAFNQEDLRGSTIIKSGECSYMQKQALCFILAHEEKLYFLIFDEEGLVEINAIKEIKNFYSRNDFTLLWVRSTT